MRANLHQKLVESVLYPMLSRYHGGKELEILAELRHSERLKPDELHDLRLKRLKEVLKHAAQYVPFYQRRFADAGFDPEVLQDFADLKKLPILTKADIQTHKEELISTYFGPKDLHSNRTGGSTGAPLEFFHNSERLDSRLAATMRHNEWAGYRVGSKAAILWGHQHDLSLYTSFKAKVRQAVIDRTLICDSSSFSDASLGDFIRSFKSFKPDIILAYANALAFVVEYCIKRNIKLPRPQAIITSAEVLTDENRQKIEEFFDTRIFDRYGSREVSIIASECDAHDGLHINAENLYLEFLDGDRDVVTGEMGDIVVTDFGNFAFPFIRYQIGDIGAPLEGQCSCGRTLPRMTMVAGRTTDFLYASDGRRVSGAAMTIYLAAEVPGILQAQIIQREHNNLIFNLVVSDKFDESSRELMCAKVDHFFGAGMRFSINLVEEIAKEPSGKYRFSICELKSTEQNN